MKTRVKSLNKLIGPPVRKVFFKLLCKTFHLRETVTRLVKRSLIIEAAESSEKIWKEGNELAHYEVMGYMLLRYPYIVLRRNVEKSKCVAFWK